MQNYYASRKWKHLPQSDCPAYSPVREAKTGISSVSPAYRGIKIGWLWNERPLINPVIPLGGGGGWSFKWLVFLSTFQIRAKNSNLFFNNKQCKNEKRNWSPFSKVMRKRNTKNEIQIHFSKGWENEKQKLKFKSPFQSAAKTKNQKRNSNPFFNVTSRQKTKNRNGNGIPFYKAEEKRKIKMKFEFHFFMPSKNGWH